MKKRDVQEITNARQHNKDIANLTEGRRLVCPSGKRSHTMECVLEQDRNPGQPLGRCPKCAKPLILPVQEIRVSWTDLRSALMEVQGVFYRRDGGGGAEPEEELAALAAHLVHRRGQDRNRVEAALDNERLHDKFALLIAEIQQQRNWGDILYVTQVDHPKVTTPAPAPHQSDPSSTQRDTHLASGLSKLLSSQFDVIIFGTGVDGSLLASIYAPQATRAVDLVRYIRQLPGGIEKLEAALMKERTAWRPLP